MNTPKKLLALAGAAAAVAAPTLATTSPAYAASRDGSCQSGEFCYYYNSNNQGSVSDFTGSVGDYGTTQPGCYEYKGAGNGKGKCIKNDAASVWNRTGKKVRVYYNSGYDGSRHYQTFSPGDKKNLNATMKNNNASHRIGLSGGGGRVDLSDALYPGGGGRITCGYDGYVNTPGRHEGIDIAKHAGADVKALVSGTVINVNESTSLSTIAVYNSGLNKTVVYLHSNPRNALDVGDHVSRGQTIADEAARGASAAHTHVEMRPGRHTLAAKSVNDYTLSNPDPTAFWHARGYDEH